MQVSWQAPINDRIRIHTTEAANRRIDRSTQSALERASDSPERIRARLAELDREWSVDRALILVFSILGGATAGLAMRAMRRTGRFSGWGALFCVQSCFVGYHAVRGWCPPLPVLRRLGFRSGAEIAAERVALEKRLAELR
jgi:hypothetical protein